MNGGQGRGEDLLGLMQMVHVGARVIHAGVAVASILDRPEVRLVQSIRDMEATIRVIDRAVSRNSRGSDAVEGVCPLLHAHEDVLRL
ncbi:MAG: hypothetical protein RL129_1152, partial [Actinomycetota bacterium]